MFVVAVVILLHRTRFFPSFKVTFWFYAWCHGTTGMEKGGLWQHFMSLMIPFTRSTLWGRERMGKQYWFMRDVIYWYDSSSSSLKNWQLKRLGKTFQRQSLRSEEGEEEKRGERMSTQKRRGFIRPKKFVIFDLLPVPDILITIKNHFLFLSHFKRFTNQRTRPTFFTSQHIWVKFDKVILLL